MGRDDEGAEKSTKIDISGMVYNEEEIDEMIQKVKNYKIKRTDHPLQIRVDILEQQNQKLKEKVEALEYLLEKKDNKIAELEKKAEESSLQHDFASSTSRGIFETPVKPEISSQKSQNTNDREMETYRISLLKQRIKESVADLKAKHQRRKSLAYLLVDRDGKGRYAGLTIQELKARLREHNDPTSMSTNIGLKQWIATLDYLESFVVYQGEAEEAALVEALLIVLGPELGFDLLNLKQEKSRLDITTKLLELDDDEKISVIIKKLPIEKDAPGHEQLVSDVRIMVQQAMEQRPLKYYRNSKHISCRATLLGVNKRHALRAETGEKSEDDEDEPVMKYATNAASFCFTLKWVVMINQRMMKLLIFKFQLDVCFSVFCFVIE